MFEEKLSINKAVITSIVVAAFAIVGLVVYKVTHRKNMIHVKGDISDEECSDNSFLC